MTATGLGICDYCDGLDNWLVTWRACCDVFSPNTICICHPDSGDILASVQFRPRTIVLLLDLASPSSGTIFFAALGIDPFGVRSFSLVGCGRRLIVVVALLESVGYQNCREPPCTGLVLALFPQFADMEV